MLASCSDGETARVWNVASGAAVHTLTGHNDYVRSIAWYPDGSGLVTGGDDGTARLWELNNSSRSVRCVRVIKDGLEDTVQAVACSACGFLVFAATSGGVVRIYNASEALSFIQQS